MHTLQKISFIQAIQTIISIRKGALVAILCVAPILCGFIGYFLLWPILEYDITRLAVTEVNENPLLNKLKELLSLGAFIFEQSIELLAPFLLTIAITGFVVHYTSLLKCQCAQRKEIDKLIAIITSLMGKGMFMVILFLSTCGGLAVGYYLAVINKVSLEHLPPSFETSMFLWGGLSLVLIVFFIRFSVDPKKIGLGTAKTCLALYLGIYFYGIFDNIDDKLSLMEQAKIFAEANIQKNDTFK